MQTVEVVSKGVTWLVHSDGTVSAPAHTSKYTRIRNGKTQTLASSFKQRGLSPCAGKHGYLEVAVKIGGKRVKHLLHRLIAMAFVPGHQEGLSVNHIDGDKLNNSPENLEWVSLARNSQHAWEIGLVDLRGEKAPLSKLTTKQVVYIRRLLAQGISAHTLSVVAGVSDSLIYRIRDGKRWPEVTARKPVA